MSSDFKIFLPLAKVDKEKRTVSGYASTPTKDMDGEIVSLDAVKAALPDYMRWGNVREMHRLSAVGTAQEANVDSKGLFLTAKIIDDAAWAKCLEGVYKGFSIGGKKLEKVGDTITEIEMVEISVVDRPANPDCRISVAKSAGGTEGAYLLPAKEKKSPEEKMVKKIRKLVHELSLSKNGPPAARDGFSLPAREPNNNIDSPADSRPEENITRKREFSTKEREHAASTGAAMPGGGYPIENEQDLRNAIHAIGRAKNPGKTKKHIKSRAAALGRSDLIPEGWGGGGKKAKKRAKKIAKRERLRELERALEAMMLTKGASGAQPRLPFDLDAPPSITEPGNFDLKPEPDPDEIPIDTNDDEPELPFGKAAKTPLNSNKDDTDMTETNGASGAATNIEPNFDDLTKALMTMVKRGAAPTRTQRIGFAGANLRKANKMRKECAAAIEDAHKMHKAAYLAKAGKAGKKPGDGDADDFDHAGAMEKLQKAFSALNTMKTFIKAARGQLEKASRSGQRGEEVGDGESGFYEVPAGVKDLSPSALAGASPGGKGGGGQPPMYPGDGGVYPGKAAGATALAKFVKNGQVPADIVELVMENARLAGEAETLKRIPASAGRRAPYAFDMTKVIGDGSDTAQRDRNASLFNGVDPAALASGEERIHTEATAKVIGNFLTSGQFGKSIMSPDFKGAAGGRS